MSTSATSEFALFAVLAVTAGTVLTDRVAAEDATSPKKAASLAIYQRSLGEMMLKLERKIRDVERDLRPTEPERADRLVKAFQSAKQWEIEPTMQKIARLLDEGDYDGAAEQQQKVVAHLKKLVKILLEDPNSFEEKLKELRRLEKWKRDIRKILKEEQDLRRESEIVADKDQALADVALQIKRLEGLIKKQQGVVDDAEKAREDGLKQVDQIADKQDDVKAGTTELANAMAGKSGGSKPTDSGSPTGSTPAEKALRKAAEHQQDAAKNLSGGKPKAGGQAAKDALGEMKKALDELKKEKSRIASLPPKVTEKLADKQLNTADKTAKISDEMKSGGSQSGGQSDGQPSGSQQPAPGQQNVQNAGNQMEKAAGDLQGGKPGDAAGKQDDAAKELEKALREIEKRLAQLREEMQIERLARLEDRFRRMLERQRIASAETKRLHVKKEEKGLGRPDKANLSALAEKERSLSDEAQLALDIIIEDGTSVVFPEVVEELRDDFRRVADRIDETEVGDYTQLVQADIEKVLEDLIEALKRAQDFKRATGGGQTSGGEQQEPLLPESAELKLLRAAQIRVNRRTVAFNELRGDDPLTDRLRNELDSISDRQRIVADMTQQMIERN